MGLTEIFRRVEQRFGRVERAHHAFLTAVRDAKRDALEDLIIHARALTNVIQNCRGVLSGFDDWYQPHVRVMSDDPGMRRFYKMRSEVLKEGSLAAAPSQLLFGTRPWFPPAPEGAIAFTPYDDETGECAWIVRLLDGTEEKRVVARPGDVHVAEFFTFTPPLNDYQEPRIEDTASRYVNYLRSMVDELRVLVLRAS